MENHNIKINLYSIIIEVFLLIIFNIPDGHN